MYCLCYNLMLKPENFDCEKSEFNGIASSSREVTVRRLGMWRNYFVAGYVYAGQYNGRWRGYMLKSIFGSMWRRIYTDMSSRENNKRTQLFLPYIQGRPVVPGPPIWNRCPPFHVWPTGCCIYPILYFKNVPPPFWFLAPPSGFWPPAAAKFWRRACIHTQSD